MLEWPETQLFLDTRAKIVDTCRTMSLYKRGNRMWSRIMHEGTVYRRALGTGDRNVARRLEAALHTQIAEGKVGITRPPVFEAFCTDFLSYAAPRVRPATYVAYTKAILSLCSLPELASARLDRVNMQQVDKFVAKCTESGLAVATINLRIRVLRRILHVAAERDLITKVPRLHGLKGEVQRELTLSESDEQRIIEAGWRITWKLGKKGVPMEKEIVMHPTMKALLPFLVDTGLRIGEACALTWADVTLNGETGTIKVSKNMNELGDIAECKTKLSHRTIPLTRRVVGILSTLRGPCFDPTAPVFTREYGTISPVWAGSWFRKACRVLGLPKGLVLHSTRHTFCTRLGKAGASAFEIQKLAGHSGIQISARYAHPDSEQLTRAIDRLNKGEK